MAALGWLTPRRRSATARSVLAGEASAEAAHKYSQEREDIAPAPDTPAAEPEFPVLGDEKAAAFWRRRGFLPSKDDPLTLFRSLPDIAASLEAAAEEA